MNKKDTIKLIAISLIVSIIFGAVAGAASFWLISQNQNYFKAWFGKEILGQKKTEFKKVVQVEEESQTVKVVKKVQPAVVSIIVTKDLSKIYSNTWPFDNFFFDFPGFEFHFPQPERPQGKKEIGGGTGFIISPDGMILTNRHVVDDEEAEYTVLMNDGTKYNAKVLARDQILDLAVIKIEAKNLPTLELGDSDKIEIGQTVIAIGNALGEFRNTVTKGVISGIGRTITAGDSRGRSEMIESAIQTDAAINPGNSGGPLVNLAGQVIGINTAISSQGQLLGFAIPINEAKRVINSVEKYGKIVRPFLGVRYILNNPEFAKKNQLKVDYGAIIVRGETVKDFAVIPGSPADKAGLQENDIILEVNGTKIERGNSLAKLLSKYAPGDEVTLKVLSKGKEKEVKVKLEEFKNEE